MFERKLRDSVVGAPTWWYVYVAVCWCAGDLIFVRFSSHIELISVSPFPIYSPPGREAATLNDRLFFCHLIVLYFN